jgi:hypothetical protein
LVQDRQIERRFRNRHRRQGLAWKRQDIVGGTALGSAFVGCELSFGHAAAITIERDACSQVCGRLVRSISARQLISQVVHGMSGSVHADTLVLAVAGVFCWRLFHVVDSPFVSIELHGSHASLMCSKKSIEA